MNDTDGLPDFLKPLSCHCRARGGTGGDAATYCRCDDECAVIGCGASADGLYNGEPRCIECATGAEFESVVTEITAGRAKPWCRTLGCSEYAAIGSEDCESCAAGVVRQKSATR